MKLNPHFIHPALLAKRALSPAERVHIDILQALTDSLRSDEEMQEAASVLDPMLDARARLSPENQADLLRRFDEVAQAILKAAQGARDARSGMGVDLCLDYLRLALDDARALTAEALG